MSEANKILARRWWEEVWNQKSEAAIDELFAADGKSWGFPEPDSCLIGPEAFKPLHRTFCGAFPDLRVTIEEVIAEGDRVAVRFKVEMTHLGDHLGPAATGRRVKQFGMAFLRVRDGKFVEGWNAIDMNYLYKQLQ
jgi:predicted ester cyclase